MFLSNDDDLFDKNNYFCILLKLWRGGRVVECGGLENRCTGNCTEGSNPSLSADIIKI